MLLSLLSLVLFWDNEVKAHDFKLEVIDDEEQQQIVENAEINRKEILINTTAVYGYTRQNRGLEQKFQEYGDGLIIEGIPNSSFISRYTNDGYLAIEFFQTQNQTRYLSLKSLLSKGDFRSFFIEKNIISAHKFEQAEYMDLPSAKESLIAYLIKIDARGH